MDGKKSAAHQPGNFSNDTERFLAEVRENLLRAAAQLTEEENRQSRSSEFMARSFVSKAPPPIKKIPAKKPASPTALPPPDYLLSVQGLHTPEELRKLAALCEEGQLLIARSLQEPLLPTVRAARKWILALTAPGRNPETSVPLRSLCPPDRWSFLRALASLRGSSPERVWPRGFSFRRLGLPDLTFRRRKRRGRPRGTGRAKRKPAPTNDQVKTRIFLVADECCTEKQKRAVGVFLRRQSVKDVAVDLKIKSPAAKRLLNRANKAIRKKYQGFSLWQLKVRQPARLEILTHTSPEKTPL